MSEKVSAILFCCLALSLAFIFPVDAATIELFSPQSTVKGVRQATARFSDQMVALGDPRLSDPFGVECPENGTGRWIDSRSWSYDFERDLPGGVTCIFTLKPGLKTLGGQVVTGEKTFVFTTGGPSVIESNPFEGDESIDEKQTFILVLDGEVDENSVSRNVYCSVEGIRERIDVRTIEGKEKEDFLKSIKHRDSRPTVLLDCRRTFPPKSIVKVIWGKGIKSKSGVATSQDQVLAFKAREPFTAGFNCTKEKADKGCMPLAPMTLGFTAPVAWDKAREVILRSEKGEIRKPGKVEDGEGNPTVFGTSDEASGLKTLDAKRFVQSVSFDGPFPENTSFTVILPEGLQDDAGRRLSNAGKFPLKVRTEAYPSLARFASRFGIIEADGEPLLPVTVRNIEKEIRAKYSISQSVNGAMKRIGVDREGAIIEWLKRLRRTDRRETIFRGTGDAPQFSIPKPGPSKEFEVIGIPLKSPGFYVIELESHFLGSRLLGKPAPMYVPASALVTNLAAHFKWGRETSLVWVTSLNKGEPVNDASVTLRDCSGKTVWQGKTDSEGIAKIDRTIPAREKLPRCRINRQKEEDGWLDIEESQLLMGIESGLFVFAKKDDDLTFTHSSWNSGIEPWRFNFHAATQSGGRENQIAHTVFDRTLVRAGETIHMQHFMRKTDMMAGFTIPVRSDFPREAVIQHVGSDQKYPLTLEWRSNGTADSTWQIPPNAKLGTYKVYLRREEEKKHTYRQEWTTGSFRVEEFRVPLMKAVVKAAQQTAVRPKEMEIDISLSFLSGGGAALAPVRLRSEVRDRTTLFPDYGEFVFSNGYPKKGVITPSYEDESSESEDGERPIGKRGGDQAVKLKTVDLTLDKTGSARTTIGGFPPVDKPMEFLAELEFRDPNGEIQTVSSRFGLYPAGIHAGISSSRTATRDDGLFYKVIAVDLNGKPMSGIEVKVTLLQKKTYSHRRRIAGGFYAYEHASEIIEVGPHCEGRTGKEGILFCERPSPVTGQIILQAEARDNDGNTAVSHYEDYVYGKADLWFEAGNDDRIDLLPEKKFYEPGEKARFQVRMPFREATVLVSLEREGIMETYVKSVSRALPIVEIPVESHHSPNVYISAFAVRGRTGEVRPTATFDGGKPAYKLGIAEIKVGWQSHQLKVDVSTDRKTYRVRDTVEVKIRARTANGKLPAKQGEIIVAAVDEGLLELKENESWRLLEAMMMRRPYEVATSTAQMMVIGKRHFGRKALPHGGGGGKQVTRDLFDTLLFWKAGVLLDEKGEATVHVPLNDSLTSFRIVAVAASGESLFGTGMATISTTQELMLLSGLPPLVREGDRFRAGFTLRNTTKRPMTVEAVLRTSDGTEKKEYSPLEQVLSPGESREIGWDMVAASQTGTMVYELKAIDREEKRGDTIRVSQKVLPAIPVRIFQATTMQTDGRGQVKTTVERPRDALPSGGGVRVTLRPEIGEALNGVAGFMKTFPYTCYEQRVSKAVALKDETMWSKLMEELPSYTDRDGLVKYFPVASMTGSDVLTSYVLAVAGEAGYAIPDGLKVRIIDGLKGFVEGRIVRRSSLPTADLTLRKVAAIEALSRYGVFAASFLNSVTIEPNAWPTSAVLDWINILYRVGGIPERGARMEEAQRILRSRLNLQGTTISFSTEKTDYCWWIMVSPDVNYVRALLTALHLNEWGEDLPRIARGAALRLKKGHWSTTVANAWGVLAMEKFSRKFESSPVAGNTRVAMADRTSSTDWVADPKGSETFFAWPAGKKALFVEHRGTGKPWVTIQALAAVPLKKPFSSGYRIRKRITPVEQKTAGTWSRGDVARVHIEVEAQSDMTWVAVNDPIPGGSTILGSGLGRDSTMLTAREGEKGRASEVFRERSFEGVRIYFDYVPKGTFTVEYTVRFDNQGKFTVPPTRVEALYAPEMFGEVPNGHFEVRR